MDRMKDAITLDCERLVEMFARNKANEFAVFCKEWKKLCFQHMYSALLRDVEIILMTENIFDVAAKILFNDDTQILRKERKIGALYLIYAIYFKQPTDRYVKFKLTLDKWKQLRGFIESLKNDPTTIQVRYIFYKLIRENAFRFVIADTDYGLEDSFHYTQIKCRRKLRSIWESVRTDMNEMNHPESGLIESLSILEGGCNEMKKLLNAQISKSGCSNSQTLELTNFFDDIKKSFQSISDILKPSLNETKGDNKNESEWSTPSFKKKEKIDERRKRLKKKAFKTDKNDEDDSYDVTVQGDLIQIAKDDSRCRKTNQTVNKIFSQNLPQETLNELNATEDAEMSVVEESDMNAIEESEMIELDPSASDKTTPTLQCTKAKKQYTGSLGLLD